MVKTIKIGAINTLIILISLVAKSNPFSVFSFSQGLNTSRISLGQGAVNKVLKAKEISSPKTLSYLASEVLQAAL